jgi:hypothetical protein
LQDFFERHADRGWSSIEDLRGIRRDRVVRHAEIKRPETKEYFGGHDVPEGYATPSGAHAGEVTKD